MARTTLSHHTRSGRWIAAAMTAGLLAVAGCSGDGEKSADEPKANDDQPSSTSNSELDDAISRAAEGEPVPADLTVKLNGKDFPVTSAECMIGGAASGVWVWQVESEKIGNFQLTIDESDELAGLTIYTTDPNHVLNYDSRNPGQTKLDLAVDGDTYTVTGKFGAVEYVSGATKVEITATCQS